MKKKNLTKAQIERIVDFQQNEINEYHLYRKLAASSKDKDNSSTLAKIADGELTHYGFWKKYSGVEVKPKKGKIFFYYARSRILGLTFGIKLMEKGEANAQVTYRDFAKAVPDAKRIARDEEDHERKLTAMIREEKLEYVGSIVLGLNDALVELTGMLAGLSLALQNTKTIAVVGLITGIAAALSMAASEYLSSKSEGTSAKESFTSSLYTGITYIFTVALLVLPFFLFSHYLLCIAVTIAVAVLVIFLFNFYISVAKDLDFKKRFIEMTVISLGVAAISFGIGFLVRSVFKIDA
jgi:VIT1/CCC1 family predicted Fe2+/Mn2+ transporter